MKRDCKIWVMTLSIGWLFSCQDAEVSKQRRSTAKSNGKTSFEPEYLSSQESTISASSDTVVQDDGVEVRFKSGSVKTDYRVRVSKMASPPDTDAVDLGGAKSAVVQVDVFDPNSNKILSSSQLANSYDVLLNYSEDEIQQSLGLMLVSNPGQDEETTALITQDQLQIVRQLNIGPRERSQIRLRLSLASQTQPNLRLTQNEDIAASISLSVTSVWLWLVNYDPKAIVAIPQTSPDKLSSVGGQTLSQISVRRSDASTSSGGSGTQTSSSSSTTTSSSSTSTGSDTTTTGSTSTGDGSGGGSGGLGLTDPLVSTGDSFSCSLSDDGEIDCWGENAFGQIGDNTRIRRDTPTRVGATNGPWVTLASGGGHNCAINTSGHLFCWGYNEFGQVGVGTTTDVLIPTRVGADSEWSKIALGAAHSCAVKISGELYCWGSNTNSEVGDGFFNDVLSPVQVATNIQEVALGETFSCALNTSGSRLCWGVNGAGQFGRGTTVSSSTPTQVGTASVWKEITAGAEHSCGIRTTGQLYCWGANDSGQLGRGTTTASTSEFQVGGAVDWVAVEAGANFTCAINTAGSLYCWGDNVLAQIQTGTRANVLSPTKIGSTDDWKTISSGFAHSCGIKNNGQIQCQGAGGSGQLGADTSQSKNTPTLISNAGSWSYVGTGGLHSCATRAGELFCWGYNMKGQLGLGNTAGVTSGTTTTPTQVGISNTWGSLSLGGQFSYIDNGASIAKFGDNSVGQLVDGTNVNKYQPGVAVDWPVAFSAGDRHVCGISLSNKLYCGGHGIYGQLGNNGTASNSSPVQVGTGNWSGVASGYGFTCGTMSDGKLYCWGRYQDGNLGLGSSVTTDQVSPQQVGSAANWTTKIATGFAHTCAIDVYDELYCWGSNAYGQLGNGNTTSQPEPVKIGAIDLWMSVTTGYFHTCALDTNRKLFCWGYNGHGEVGNGSFTNALSPTQIGTATWQKISANGNHTCGIREDNGSYFNLYCWGINELNQLGTASTTMTLLPAP